MVISASRPVAPLTITTGSFGWEALIFSKTSAPLMPSMKRSRRTRSNFSVSRRLSANSPLGTATASASGRLEAASVSSFR